MTIRLNGVERQAPDGATLLGLIEGLPLQAGRVAVEINGRVVTRSEYGRTSVRDGDVLEVVQFVGGG